MKHIKLFNQLFESSSVPYEEITREEYNQLTVGEGDVRYEQYDDEEDYTWFDDIKFIEDFWMAFTDKEIEMVRELLPDVKAKNLISTDTQGARLDSKESGIIMIKLKDEWYYVMMNMSDQEEDDKFFKCDQFEGLLQLIKDYI
jgi:hypothetical protein